MKSIGLLVLFATNLTFASAVQCKISEKVSANPSKWVKAVLAGESLKNNSTNIILEKTGVQIKLNVSEERYWVATVNLYGARVYAGSNIGSPLWLSQYDPGSPGIQVDCTSNFSNEQLTNGDF